VGSVVHTIRSFRPFRYRDELSGVIRLGYYDPHKHIFVAMDKRGVIRTVFHANSGYIKGKWERL